MPGDFAEDEIAIRILVATQQAVKATKDLATQLKSLKTTGDGARKSVEQIEPAANKAGKGLFSLTNIVRTALGTLEAMAIFLVTRFVGEAIKKTIDSLQQLELSFYKLSIAEASLSKSGVDITVRDLMNISSEISKIYSFVSKIDASKIVGQVSLLTKDLRLTKEQIRDLSLAIPALALSTGESIDETTKAISEGIAKNGRGLADQNVQVNAQIIAQKAVELQLVANEEAYKNLTAEQKQYIDVSALVAIITDAANESMQKQGELSHTATSQTKLLSAEWENFLTEAGIVLAPVLINSLDFLISLVGILRTGVMALRLAFIGALSVPIAGFGVLNDLMQGNIKSADDLVASINKYGSAAAVELFKMTSGAGNFGADTPTGAPSPIDTSKQEDIVGATEKYNKEILDAQIKFSQDMQDVAIDLGRKMVDITAEYARKRADAEKDYTDKVADINRSYADKISDIRASQAEANSKARSDELQKEKEFQNKLQEMRENFLMDLDDALHARDARQILKLIKQYELDKLQAERKHKLDMESDADSVKLQQAKFARERADAEKERQAKLAEAQRDYNDKIAKLKADEEAEVQAAVLAANRKIQDLEKNNADRLAIIAANLVSEFNLTQQGLQAIAELYHRYYADVSQVYAAMQTMLGGMRATPLNPYSGGQRPFPSGDPSQKKFAEGGSMLANRPTSVTFGEAGMELATFTPIGRNGKDVSKLFSSLGGDSGSSSGGGKLGIELFLSPDLEARIVQNTLNKTADIVTRIGRSKN